MYVSQSFIMNAETDDLLLSGDLLQDGMLVLLYSDSMRIPINAYTGQPETGKSPVILGKQALKYNRWATVTQLRTDDQNVRFVAVYEDGMKLVFAEMIEESWYVKKDTIPEVFECDEYSLGFKAGKKAGLAENEARSWPVDALYYPKSDYRAWPRRDAEPVPDFLERVEHDAALLEKIIATPQDLPNLKHLTETETVFSDGEALYEVPVYEDEILAYTQKYPDEERSDESVTRVKNILNPCDGSGKDCYNPDHVQHIDSDGLCIGETDVCENIDHYEHVAPKTN